MSSLAWPSSGFSLGVSILFLESLECETEETKIFVSSHNGSGMGSTFATP